MDAKPCADVNRKRCRQLAPAAFSGPQKPGSQQKCPSGSGPEPTGPSLCGTTRCDLHFPGRSAGEISCHSANVIGSNGSGAMAQARLGRLATLGPAGDLPPLSLAIMVARLVQPAFTIEPPAPVSAGRSRRRGCLASVACDPRLTCACLHDSQSCPIPDVVWFFADHYQNG